MGTRGLFSNAVDFRSACASIHQNSQAGGDTEMKYILLIYGEERVWGSMSQEQMAQIYAGHRLYGEEMMKAGVMKGGSELKPAATATSIRFANGHKKTVDGP